jgi:4-amino-4-deoxy-L-arabinose transferase-like glycosyltransferase
MSTERSGLEKNHAALFSATAILLIAFALRVIAIDAIPPGLTHDEVSQLDVARQFEAGDWRLLYPGGFAEDGAEIGYYPSVAAAEWIWGRNSLAWRLPAIFGGLIGLACLYALTARMFRQRVALIALGAAAVTWWHILLSRVILREVLEIPLYTLALYAFWRGFETATQPHRARYPWKMFALGGAALGLLQYIHTIPRGLFVVFVIFGLYLLIVQRALFKQAWRGIAIFVIVAEVIAAPMVITASLNPQVDNEVTLASLQLTGEEGLLTRFQNNTPWVLGQFMFAGDDGWEFNLPYRPIFEPIAALVFFSGVLSALLHFKRPAMALALIVLGVSLLPSIFLKSNFTFGRMTSGQAVVYAFVGLGAEAIGLAASRVIPARAQRPLAIGSIAILLGAGLIATWNDMFVTWPALPQTRSTYNAQLRDLGRYLDAQDQPPSLAQCVLWIVYPWRPRYHLATPQATLPYFMRREDVSVRWHDCRYAFVIPGGGQFIFAHSDLQPLENFLGRGLKKPWLNEAQPVPGVSSALKVDARAALAEKQMEWDQLAVAWPPEARAISAAQLPIDFNHAVELIGYQIKPQQVKPGDSVRVITAWRVTGELPSDLIAFTHLYRTPAEIMAQQDQLDVDGPSLRPGDVFMQSHEFVAVPPDTPSGTYPIGVGLYRKDTGERWPIWVGDQRAADRIFLSPVQVTP